MTAIQKSCGCQASQLVVGTVAPAGGVLKVPYKVPGLPGKRAGSLLINTDSSDPFFKEIVLSLRGVVQANLWADPPTVLFGTVEDERIAEQELNVRSIVPGLLESFRQVTASRGNVIVERDRNKPEELAFRLTLSASAPEGELHDLISLECDNRDYQRLNVMVRAHKTSRFAVFPNIAKLSPFLDDQAQMIHVRLMSVPQGEFRIRKIECADNITVSEGPRESRHVFDLSIYADPPSTNLPATTVVFHTEPLGKATMIIEYAVGR